MITITGPKSLTLPAAMGGDDQIYALTLVGTTRGSFVHDNPGAEVVSIEGLRDTGLITFGIIALLLSKGAEISGYPAYFEIDDISLRCPFSDSDETWEKWGTFGESHKPVKLGAKWYRSTCVGASGEPLLASQWGHLITAPEANVRMKSLDEFRAIELERNPGPNAP